MFGNVDQELLEEVPSFFDEGTIFVVENFFWWKVWDVQLSETILKNVLEGVKVVVSFFDALEEALFVVAGNRIRNLTTCRHFRIFNRNFLQRNIKIKRCFTFILFFNFSMNQATSIFIFCIENSLI